MKNPSTSQAVPAPSWLSPQSTPHARRRGGAAGATPLSRHRQRRLGALLLCLALLGLGLGWVEHAAAQGTVQADLAITNTNEMTVVRVNTSLTYTIVVTNNGPSAVTNATVVDTFPADLTAVTWTCTAVPAPGASCQDASGSGNLNTRVTLPVGGTATFTVSGTVAPNAGSPLANIATVTLPTGVTDPLPDNNSASDVDAVFQEGATVDLAITKTDEITEVVSGTEIMYTIVVTFVGGTASIVRATVVDTFPAALTGVTWTCEDTPGASSCINSGSGNLNTPVTLRNGSMVTFRVTGMVAPNAGGPLVNIATVTVETGREELDPDNNSDTDIDIIDPVADVTVTVNVPPEANAGDLVTGTVTCTNTGPHAAANATC